MLYSKMLLLLAWRSFQVYLKSMSFFTNNKIPNSTVGVLLNVTEFWPMAYMPIFRSWGKGPLTERIPFALLLLLVIESTCEVCCTTD